MTTTAPRTMAWLRHIDAGVPTPGKVEVGQADVGGVSEKVLALEEIERARSVLEDIVLCGSARCLSACRRWRTGRGGMMRRSRRTHGPGLPGEVSATPRKPVGTHLAPAREKGVHRLGLTRHDQGPRGHLEPWLGAVGPDVADWTQDLAVVD